MQIVLWPRTGLDERSATGMMILSLLMNADFRRLPTCLFHTQLRPQRIQVFPMFLLS